MGEQSPSLQVPEAEGGALPAPDIGRPWLSGDWAKWLTAAVLLFVVAGGYWAFSQNHRAKLEQARALAESPEGPGIVAVDRAGRLRDGGLDATGSSRNGRTATLNWRKSATGSR